MCTPASNPTIPALEKMGSTKKALKSGVTLSTLMERRKGGTMLRTIFNSLTNIFVDQLAKVPASLMNNFSSVNNTLSVTIVPNEGIISHEFFKSLTGHKDSISDNMYKQDIVNKELSMEFLDTVKFNHEIHIGTDNFLRNTNDSKFSTVDDFDLCSDSEPLFVNEKPFGNKDISKNQSFEEAKSESDDSEENMEDIPMSEIIFEDKLISHKVLHNSKSPLKESTQNDSKPTKNPISKMLQKVINGVSNQFQTFSSVSKTSTKKHLSAKIRRNVNCASGRRGRGRGKSQLRRNGVSQTRHRKERSKHEIFSDIQDDLGIWEEFDAYTIPFSYIDQNDDSNNAMNTESPSYSLSFELIDIKPKKTKQAKNGFVKSKDFSMEVKYVPECLLEDREASCIIDKTPRRLRLNSEASVDSEDSFIVFETESESDLADFNYLDENEMNDSETESESDSEAEIETDVGTEVGAENENEDVTPKCKVRFNLTPKVHKIVAWDYAYRSSRVGPWEQIARDRVRFNNKIQSIGRTIEPILAPDFRTKIWKERFTALE